MRLAAASPPGAGSAERRCERMRGCGHRHEQSSKAGMSAGRFAPERLARLRARSQGLHRPPDAGTPAEVARAMGGAQAQEPRAGRLQFRVRSRSLSAADVERARVEERSVLRTWVMRGTVHLVATDDAGWLCPLFADRISSWSRRRLSQLGVSDSQRDRALAAVGRALEDGPLTRGEAMEVAGRAGFEVNVQTRTQLSILLVAAGTACIGPSAGRDSMLVATRDWIGAPERRDRDASLAELARRYVGAFAPVTDRDFAAWSGLPLRDCRAGLERIAGELDQVRLGRETALVPRGMSMRAPRSPVVRLLPAFDTYLMGYSGRGHAVDPAGERRVLPGGGVLRPTICVDGRFVGLWASKRSGKRLAVTLDPFDPLDERVAAALADEARDIGRFEDVQAELR